MKYPRFSHIGLFLLLLSPAFASAQGWTTKLDKDVRFYQPSDLGVLIVGTEKSLYAIDSGTGDILWRRKDTSLDETDVAQIPGETEREVRLSDLDERFVTDEALGLLFVSTGNRVLAYSVTTR
jgi:outer membrane protein assembly factor BamB